MSTKLTGYFLVNSRGYKTAVGLSAGFNEGFSFVANPTRNRQISTLKEMHHFVLNRLNADPSSRIEDSEGNVLEQRDLFDFAAYARFRPAKQGRNTSIDKDGFKFTLLSQPEMNALYATLAR